MKKGFKIAMLIDGWEPVFGGGQIHVENLCKLLIKNHSCTVDLFVRKLKDKNGKKYNRDKKLLNNKLKIFRVGPTTKFFNLFGRIFSLVNTTIYLFIKAKKEKYDVIHAHAYVNGLPAIIVGKLFKIPVVYTVHGTMGLDYGKKGLIYYIEKWLIVSIKYNLEISVSKNIYKYNPNSKNIIVIYNGVNINNFNKEKNFIKNSGFNFLWVGRYSWQKGLKYLINGIGLIDKKLLDKKGFKLNLVGDGEEKEEIKKLIKKLDLINYIEIKGKIFGEKLIEEYKKNHIFILPSLAEGQPLTVLEAFAAKLPIITTNVGDNKYFVNKENGFLIKPGDASKIKNVIEKVLNYKKSELEKLGKIGYNLVSNKYSWDTMTDNIYLEYNKLLGK